MHDRGQKTAPTDYVVPFVGVAFWPRLASAVTLSEYTDLLRSYNIAYYSFVQTVSSQQGQVTKIRKKQISSTHEIAAVA